MATPTFEDLKASGLSDFLAEAELAAHFAAEEDDVVKALAEKIRDALASSTLPQDERDDILDQIANLINELG